LRSVAVWKFELAKCKAYRECIVELGDGIALDYPAALKSESP
jgi:hypothetical protein